MRFQLMGLWKRSTEWISRTLSTSAPIEFDLWINVKTSSLPSSTSRKFDWQWQPSAHIHLACKLTYKVQIAIGYKLKWIESLGSGLRINNGDKIYFVDPSNFYIFIQKYSLLSNFRDSVWQWGDQFDRSHSFRRQILLIFLKIYT